MFEVLDQDTILIIADNIDPTFEKYKNGLTIIANSMNDVALIANSEANLRLTVNLDPSSSGGLSEGEVIALIRSESMFANYKTQRFDEDGNTSYVGKLKISGEYLISKIVDSSGDLDLNYANISNNSSYITFLDAWNNRAILNYTFINNLSGV